MARRVVEGFKKKDKAALQALTITADEVLLTFPAEKREKERAKDGEAVEKMVVRFHSSISKAVEDCASSLTGDVKLDELEGGDAGGFNDFLGELGKSWSDVHIYLRAGSKRLDVRIKNISELPGGGLVISSELHCSPDSDAP